MVAGADVSLPIDMDEPPPPPIGSYEPPPPPPPRLRHRHRPRLEAGRARGVTPCSTAHARQALSARVCTGTETHVKATECRKPVLPLQGGLLMYVQESKMGDNTEGGLRIAV